jgi:putative oxidoreductase
MEQQATAEDRFRSAAILVDRASHWVRLIAQPSLVQLVLRFALAVPFGDPASSNGTGSCSSTTPQ